MCSGVIFDGLAALARVGMDNDFDQRWEFMEEGVTNFLGDEVTLQDSEVAIHGDVHFAP